MDVMEKAPSKKRLIDADAFLEKMKRTSRYFEVVFDVEDMPTVDAVEVVRCRECKHSTLPSELTQRYGKPGTLTCHNMHAPSNRRNVGRNDFCSYGERKDGDE